MWAITAAAAVADVVVVAAAAVAATANAAVRRAAGEKATQGDARACAQSRIIMSYGAKAVVCRTKAEASPAAAATAAAAAIGARDDRPANWTKTERACARSRNLLEQAMSVFFDDTAQARGVCLDRDERVHKRTR